MEHDPMSNFFINQQIGRARIFWGLFYLVRGILAGAAAGKAIGSWHWYGWGGAFIVLAISDMIDYVRCGK